MPIEGLHARQQFFVIAQRDENLCVVADSLLQHGQRPLADFVLLERTELALVELGFGYMDVLTVNSASLVRVTRPYSRDAHLMAMKRKLRSSRTCSKSLVLPSDCAQTA